LLYYSEKQSGFLRKGDHLLTGFTNSPDAGGDVEFIHSSRRKKRDTTYPPSPFERKPLSGKGRRSLHSFKHEKLWW